MCRGGVEGAAAIFNSGGCSQRKEEVTGDETDCRNTADIEGSGTLLGGELVSKCVIKNVTDRKESLMR